MKDKKCKDCLELSGERVPVCNYHQGYYKALKEVKKMIDKGMHKWETYESFIRKLKELEER